MIRVLLALMLSLCLVPTIGLGQECDTTKDTKVTKIEKATAAIAKVATAPLRAMRVLLHSLHCRHAHEVHYEVQAPAVTIELRMPLPQGPMDPDSECPGGFCPLKK